MSENDHYVRTWKCQVSVGELYRWILAKLSDKDIKRALHKYRDLMPRQSDWNRKLTQATNIPELGFRYLYRCGQIDESNHRTMQKMLKYIDRQDVLPYFDTILYNTNNSNCSIDELKTLVLDPVEEFLKYATCLSEEEVHPSPVYEVHQCQPVKNARITRSRSKRALNSETDKCHTSIKKARLSNSSSSNHIAGGMGEPMDTSQDGSATPVNKNVLLSACFKSASNICGQVRSAIMAAGLGGPLVHSHLASSIISMLNALKVNIPGSDLASGSTSTQQSSVQSRLDSANLTPASLLAALPHLLAFTDLVPTASLRRMLAATRTRPDQYFLSPNRAGANAAAPANNNNGGRSAAIHDMAMTRQAGIAILRGYRGLAGVGGAQMGVATGVVPVTNGGRNFTPPLSGGVGITASLNDSCMYYYCRLRMRIRLDLGPMPNLRGQVQVLRQGLYEQQLEIFAQASNLLNTRSTGEYLCHLRFNQLHQLESFWRDYQSGALRKFLTQILLDPTVPSMFQESNQLNRVIPTNGPSQDRAMPEWLSPAVLAEYPAAADKQDPFTALMDSLREIRQRVVRPTMPTATPAPFAQANFGVPPMDLPPGMAAIPVLDQQGMPRHMMPPAAGQQQQPAPHEERVTLHLYISRREYENGRCLLMRNLRDVPSMCRLVAASKFLPSLVPQMFTSSAGSAQNGAPDVSTATTTAS